MERAIMCPQCNAPLAPNIFARSIKCLYCGATVQLDESVITASLFHKAFRIWNSPLSYEISNWVSLGENHWALDKFITSDDIADVYSGRRARWPTELVILKLLRDQQDSSILNKEWESLQILLHSEARGSDTFTTLLPQPIDHGKLTSGKYAGGIVSIYRWESGFQNTLEKIIQVYPEGIPPRTSIWVWRRVLEILSFIHASGVVHGAVMPSNILIQDNEHGLRLVDYYYAGRIGEKMQNVPEKIKSFFPDQHKSKPVYTVLSDLQMSARCIIAALGGDPVTGTLPSIVPAPLVEVIQRIADSHPVDTPCEDAWIIREELGKIADRIYGPPQFCPIKMPT